MGDAAGPESCHGARYPGEALRFLVRDRGKFIAAFDEVFRADGVRITKTRSKHHERMRSASGSWEHSARSARPDADLQQKRHPSKILTGYTEHYTIAVRIKPAASDRRDRDQGHATDHRPGRPPLHPAATDPRRLDQPVPRGRLTRRSRVTTQFWSTTGLRAHVDRRESTFGCYRQRA
jgi:hypothetical protein